GFSANGRDTLEALDPNYQSTIGQRTGLSFSDAKKVNLAYCNGKYARFRMCVCLISPCLQLHTSELNNSIKKRTQVKIARCSRY
uniref:Peptidase M12A domain-containing protein n=1 Tax=Ascaris lumbricoides TaxID=6252 RepID=A0A0M3HMH2_ASCLU